MFTSKIKCIRILDRYMLREVAQTWLAVTSVLLFILLSSTFARVLGEAASNDLPKEAVFTVLGLFTVSYLTVLVPVGLFLSIMLALGRLYKDSEMAAAQACGIGPASVYSSLVLLAILLGATVAWLSMSAGPWAARKVDGIFQAAKMDADFGRIVPGKFTSPGGDDDVVFYAEDVSADGLLSNVFIQRKLADRIELVVAERGQQSRSNRAMGPAMVLYDGERYEGIPGTVDYQITRFQEHGIPIPVRASDEEELPPKLLRTRELLWSSDLSRLAELQWRLSAPISVMLLTVLAVPLGKARPREGQYARMAVAVLVFLVYYNLLGASRVWTERGELPVWLGLWWVHALVFALAMLMLARQSGIFRRAKRVAMP